MSKNPNCKSNDDDDDDNDDAAWRDAQGMWREFTWGGAWNWTFRAGRRYLDPKREHPTMSMVAHHLVHLNSHLEVYIVRHTHRAGKKDTVSVSTNSNVSFCGTYGCSNLSLSSHRWVLGKWMSKNPNVKSNGDGDEEDDDDDGDDDDVIMMMMLMMVMWHCEGAAAWRDSPGIWREFPLGGGRGGSLSPGRSRIRGPAGPFASQSKTQGSPLGGYLSWKLLTQESKDQNSYKQWFLKKREKRLPNKPQINL